MTRSIIIFALATLLSATSVLSAHAGISLASDKVSNVAMMVDCRECPKNDDCNNSDLEQSNCQMMCQLACAAGAVASTPPYPKAEVQYLAALAFEAPPERRIRGLSPSEDIPPPKI